MGANYGQGRLTYFRNKLTVLWVEAIPDVYKVLVQRLEPFPNQRAINALLTDRDGATYTFHVANNDGMSSSIYDFKHHRDIWPEIDYVGAIVLQSRTLTSVLTDAAIDLQQYDALVLDTQGSELLVLSGAEGVLSNFKFVQVEAADFEIYSGGCQGQHVTEFLEKRGFRVVERHVFARRRGGGSCFDLLFERID